MKFTKNWKRFWTLTRHNEGFTLVELIVVIAILAILAGIAVPAYSGYINKANKASDLQLVSAINTAFAAACLENGVDVSSVDSAAISIENKVVKAITSPAAYNDAFQKYFAGNTGIQFNVIERLVFDSEKHVFVDLATAGSVTLSYGGGKITVSADDAQALAGSSFGDMGSATLLGKVDAVAGIGALLSQDGSADTYVDLDAFAKELGFADETEFENWANGSAEGGTADWDRYDKIVGNSMILSAAQKTESMTPESITALLKSDVKAADLANSDGLAKAAALYSMYTAYAQSTNNTDLMNKLGNVNDLNGLTSIMDTSDDFKTWVDSDKGQSDLDAYLSAMDIINQSTKDDEATKQVLVNGFGDQALNDLLGSIIGK